MIKKFYLLFFIFIFAACSNAEYTSKTKILLDTSVSISIPKNSDVNSDEVLEHCFTIIEELENHLSSYSDSSDISKINNNAGKSFVHVTEETIEFLSKLKKYSQMTSGYFDPAVSPLLDLWGFTDTLEQTLPDSTEIKEVLPLINYKNIIIKEDSVMLKLKNMKIDVGGSLKGYALDKVKEYLLSKNITSALLNTSSTISAVGLKNAQTPWRVGLIDPENLNSIKTVLKFNDMNLSTSGDYHNYFEYENKIYHHILNPFTGYPEYKYRSVSVVSDSAFITDILSTAFFLMDFEKIEKVLTNFSSTDVLVIFSDGKIQYTEGFERYLTD